MLYNILISPLELFIEIFYKLLETITKNPGIAVIGLSFFVSFATLPLYIIAEQWQEKERLIQEKLKPGVERIKNTFKGDEQYMILNVYYKQNHYHPIMALRSSFSLLIQIPFFIAAYNFLSNLGSLNNYSFLFIKNFGAPDSTFHIGSFNVNVLPILMTLINCIAGFIYTRGKGHTVNEKVQINVCAFVFLLLLYNSPSGLVVYWTMNNVLSLVKNIFYKIKSPAKIIHIICVISAFFMILSSFFWLKEIDKMYKYAFVLLSLLLIFYPYILNAGNRFVCKYLSVFESHKKSRFSIFFLSCLILSILSGLVIPSVLIESEVNLYCYIDSYKSPFPFIYTTFAKSIGLFLLWPSTFYFLFSNKTKNALTFIFANLALISLINTFVFSGNYGSIEPTLIFMEPQNFNPGIKTILLNLSAISFIFIITLTISNKKMVLLNSLCTIILISLLSFSTITDYSIYKTYTNIEDLSNVSKIDPIFHLSKNKKNVIVIMSDACLTGLIPEVFADTPGLQDSFKGFTYYPNCISHGSVTMIGTPGLFGGFDYIPFNSNKDLSKTLQQKHNEAVLTMPILFNSIGFDTTVADIPYENYLKQPVSNMYKDYPYINRYTTHGKYTKIWYNRHGIKQTPHTSYLINRNFICFSIFKMVPSFLRGIVYSHEYWISYDPYDDERFFVDNYSELEYLTELTDFNTINDSFIIIDNEITHNDKFLSNEKLNNLHKSKYSNDSVFDVYVASFMHYAKFLDYLRENEVYDNTRIIIVSDHGRHLNDNSIQVQPNERLTATLMVKDFNSNTPLKTDNTLMSNADTPYLATQGLIDNAKNPFTGSLLKPSERINYMITTAPAAESTRNRNNLKFKIDDNQWIYVKDNIYVEENWQPYEYSQAIKAK